MPDDYDLTNPAGGLVAYQLSLFTLLMLERKGVFTHRDMVEIVELCLLNLETLEAKVDPASQETSRMARTLLEGLRQRISRPAS